jgi:hypothetical protein
MSVTITLFHHDRVTRVKGLNEVIEMPLQSIVDAMRKGSGWDAFLKGSVIWVTTGNPSMVYTWLTSTQILKKEVPINFLICYERL